MQSQTNYLNTVQAAEYIGVSMRTLYELTRTRKIKHYKPGGGRLILFKVEDLEDFIEAGAVDRRREMTPEYEQELIQSML